MLCQCVWHSWVRLLAGDDVWNIGSGILFVEHWFKWNAFCQVFFKSTRRNLRFDHKKAVAGRRLDVSRS